MHPRDLLGPPASAPLIMSSDVLTRPFSYQQLAKARLNDEVRLHHEGALNRGGLKIPHGRESLAVIIPPFDTGWRLLLARVRGSE